MPSDISLSLQGKIGVGRFPYKCKAADGLISP